MAKRQIAPFGAAGYWFKGNLHTHTTQSDGEISPEEAIAWYRQHHYDFLALTDHWVHTPGRQVAPGFITVTGAELHGERYHLLALGLSALPDRGLAEDPQAIVDAVRQTGGLPFFAHPYWTQQSASDIAAVTGLAGIEVYNAVCEEMDGLGYASVHWDELLSRGQHVLGLAVDDTHWRPAHHAQGKGFVMVKADALEESALLQALERGHFYASTGPRIHALYLAENEGGDMALHVRCSPCRLITFYARGPRGKRFVAEPGGWLDGASWPVRASQVYLRVACEDFQGGIAWSNPVYVADMLGGEAP